ncbi:tryptophan decarboxylase 2 isoform X2 [Setaria viridis]|uniref:tryptophan decarboxylase 2 isoform X2 n=1 Tax=Setaria viridis TaxID=4556 RepID=UPI003B3AF247
MDGSGSSNEGANGGGEWLRPMDAEQLRECGHRMVDFVADYYKSIETFPVLSQVQARYLKELLPDTAPSKPDTLEALFDDIREKIVPGVTHWQSPNYFAYYPSNSSTAGFLGEMLSAAFNIVGFSWITSPAATELEVIVLDWFAKMLNLPSQFLSSALGGGVIQGTASEAVLVVLLAARDRTLRKHGKTSLEKLVVYASDQTHSSLQKACQIAGIFPENVRVVKADCNKNYAVAPEAIFEAISTDLSSVLIPFFICATVGTTSSSAVDPLPELGQIAKDRSYLIQSLSTNPEYLKNKASQANSVLDFKDWQIPLGRRFRSLKLWMVLRLYGVENLQSYIRKHIGLAKYFEELVISDSRFEVVTPRTFSLVCFRLLPLASDQDNGYKLNYGLMDAANSSGKIFISHTVLSGKFILRFVVGAPLTEEQHVFAAWKVLQDLATKQLGSS